MIFSILVVEKINSQLAFTQTNLYYLYQTFNISQIKIIQI
jgi:hypothetical protein